MFSTPRMISCVFALLVVGALVARAQQVAVTPTAGPPSAATLCIFGTWAPIASHASFSARYYAPLYPSTNFRIKILPALDLREVVRQWLINGSDCDYVGHSDTSSHAIALSPLVPASVAWIDSSATSTELSNSLAHPTFRRVVPTDAVGAGGAALFAISQGWKLANILCEDNAYGRSVAEGFATKFAALGGQVEFSRCFPSDTDDATAAEIVTPLVEGTSSRVVFVAGMVWRLERVFRRLRVPSRMIMIFSEANCTSPDLQLFPGSFCARYSTVPAETDAYRAAFAARDMAIDHGLLGGSFPRAEIDDVVPDIFWGAMAADATHLGMEAITTYHAANRTLHPTLSDWVTAVTIRGQTGTVSLLPNGDREAATLAVFNMQPLATSATGEFALQEVATVDGSNLIYPTTLTASSATAPPMWYSVVGERGGFAAAPPSATTTADAAGDPMLLPAWALAVIVVAVVAAAALAVFRVTQRTAAAATLARCPLDENAPFTVFFVGVKNEGAIRDLYPPEESAVAFARVSAIVRAAARSTGCHEARRVNDTTVMVVAKQPAAALECAARIATDCAAEAWPAVLKTFCADGHPTAPTPAHRSPAAGATTLLVPPTRAARSVRGGGSRRSGRSSRAPSTSSHPSQAGGSRAKIAAAPLVNIGIHTGFGAIDHDEHTGVVSYHGTVVDEAACVADAAVGGHIAVSEATAEAIHDEDGGADRKVAVLDGTLAPFRTITPPIARGSFRAAPQPSALQTFTPTGYTLAADVARRIEELLAARSAAGAGGAGGSDGDDDLDRSGSSAGVTAALSQADCGLASKRVATVCIHVPAFAPNAPLPASAGVPGAMPMSAAERRQTVTEVMGEIHASSTRRKGRLMYASDTRVYLSVNGQGPSVARPETRALQMALDVCDEAAFHCPALRGSTAGVAFGRATVGELHACSIVLGTCVATSRMMQVAATEMEVPLLATDACFDDIKSTFHAVTVDLAAVPLGVGRSAATRLTRLVAVAEARDAAADGEWMYHIESAKLCSSQTPPREQHATADLRTASLAEGASVEAGWSSLITTHQAAGSPAITVTADDNTTNATNPKRGTSDDGHTTVPGSVMSAPPTTNELHCESVTSDFDDGGDPDPGTIEFFENLSRRRLRVAAATGRTGAAVEAYAAGRARELGLVF